MCFALTGEERLVLGALVAIALVGIVARYLHLKSEQAEPYQPASVTLTREARYP